jgi:uncharacterized delta-60 repeat protein
MKPGAIRTDLIGSHKADTHWRRRVLRWLGTGADRSWRGFEALEPRVLLAASATPGVDLRTQTDSGVSMFDNLTNFDNSTPAKALMFDIYGVPLGSLLELKLDGVLLASMTVQTSGVPVLTTDGATPLPQGPNYFIFTCTEPGKTPASRGFTVTIDSIAPDVAPAPVLLQSLDIGVSDSDHIVPWESVDFSSVNSRLHVYVNGEYQGIEDGPTAGAALVQGINDIAVVVVDDAGNQSPLSPSLRVIADLVAPKPPGTSGQLDLRFADRGSIISNLISGSKDEATDVVVQPDGRFIVLAAESDALQVSRWNLDGSADTTFGNGGSTRVAFANKAEFSGDLALQPDGKIVISGYGGDSEPGYSSTWELKFARLNSDGTLDSSFGVDGRQSISINPQAGNKLGGMALTDNGEIIAIGTSSDGADVVSVVKLLPDGSRDTSFGTNGIKQVSIPSDANNTMVNAVALQDDGKIVLGGQVYQEPTINGDTFVARLTAQGDLDASFAQGGIAITSLAFSGDWINELLIQPDGRILAGGYAAVGSLGYGALLRFTTDGELDPTFNDDGQLLLTYGAFTSDIGGMALRPDGRILVAGYSHSKSGSEESTVGLAQLHTNGALDTTFGTGGKAVEHAGGFAYVNEVHALALALDGSIITVGTRRSVEQQWFDGDTRIARFTNDDLIALLPDSDTGVSGISNFTTDRTPSFNVSSLYYQLYLNGDNLSETFQTGTTTLSTLPEGAYTLTAKSYSIAGRTSGFSRSFSFTIDTTAPTGAWSAVVQPEGWPMHAATLQFSEAVVGLELGDVRLLRDGRPVDLQEAVLQQDPQNSRRWMLLNLDAATALPGQYQLSIVDRGVRLRDFAGNSPQSVAPAEFSVLAFTGSMTSDGAVNEASTAHVWINATDYTPGSEPAVLTYSYDFNNDGLFDLIDSPDASAPVPAELTADGPMPRRGSHGAQRHQYLSVQRPRRTRSDLQRHGHAVGDARFSESQGQEHSRCHARPKRRGNW